MTEHEHDKAIDEKMLSIAVLNERLCGLKQLIVQYDRLTKENFNEYKQLTKELATEHNRLTQLAIDKAEIARASKDASMNEFRGQLDDMGKTFARQDKVESYIQSSTARYEENVKVQNDKIYQLEKQMDQKLSQGVQIITDKFEAMNKTGSVKMENIEVVMDKRFEDLMKDYIRPQMDWKNNMQGRGIVLLWIWPIVLALITFFISSYLKK